MRRALRLALFTATLSAMASTQLDSVHAIGFDVVSDSEDIVLNGIPPGPKVDKLGIPPPFVADEVEGEGDPDSYGSEPPPVPSEPHLKPTVTKTPCPPIKLPKRTKAPPPPPPPAPTLPQKTPCPPIRLKRETHAPPPPPEPEPTAPQKTPCPPIKLPRVRHTPAPQKTPCPPIKLPKQRKTTPPPPPPQIEQEGEEEERDPNYDHIPETQVRVS